MKFCKDDVCLAAVLVFVLLAYALWSNNNAGNDGETTIQSSAVTTQEAAPSTTEVTTTTPAGIKTFTDNGGAVELKKGKPVIRLFSTTWCPHCEWIKDAYDQTVKEYMNHSEIVAYHWQFDTDEDTLRTEKVPVPQSERDIFRRFNPGGTIPTFVFGGKYYRIGNGYEAKHDLEAEKAEFRAVIDELIREARELKNQSATA